MKQIEFILEGTFGRHQWCIGSRIQVSKFPISVLEPIIKNFSQTTLRESANVSTRKVHLKLIHYDEWTRQCRHGYGNADTRQILYIFKMRMSNTHV